MTYKDARPYFDDYTLRHSTPLELAEVLAYTHIYGEYCWGRVLRLRAQLPLEPSLMPTVTATPEVTP